MSEEYFLLTGQLGGDMVTTKQETVLEKARRQHHGEPWIFVTPDDGGLPGAQVRLTDREWEDLGRPDTITVAIWPGDQLNSEPLTRAVREQVEGDVILADGKRVIGAYETKRRFHGVPSSDLEEWLGDAFMSWMPSRRLLIVVEPDGTENIAEEGDLVTQSGRVVKPPRSSPRPVRDAPQA